MRQSVRNGFSGTTLVELVVAMAKTSAVLLGTMTIMSTSRNAITLCTLDADLSSQALNICDRIANDLKDGVKGTVTPSSTSASNTLTFQKCMGYNASGVILGNTITYSLITGVTADTYHIIRTENWQVDILSTSATPTGLVFNIDPSSAPNNDVWNIQVQLAKPDYLDRPDDFVKYSTMVQLKL